VYILKRQAVEGSEEPEMTTVQVDNPGCVHHPHQLHCPTHLEQDAGGTWLAKCRDLACTTVTGASVWRAGGMSSPFTYDQLVAMAQAHCLRHHQRDED
jgi:hypothetical protein